MLDRALGPLMLELNARPGLQIQIANADGLGRRLAAVEAGPAVSGDPAERMAFARARFTETSA